MLIRNRQIAVGVFLIVPFVLLAVVTVMILNTGMILFPPLVVPLLGGLIFTGLCFRSPLSSFALLASMNVFQTALVLVPTNNPSSTGLINTITVVDLLLLVLLAVTLIKGMFCKKESALTAARLHALFILLCFAMFVMFLPGLVNANVFSGLVAISRAGNSLRYGIVALFFIRSRADLRHFLIIAMPFYVLAALWGWYEIAAGEYILISLGHYVQPDVMGGTDVGFVRAIGPVGDSVYFSIVLVVGMALSMMLYQMASSRALRLASFAVIVLCGLSTLATGSRAGLIAAFLVLSVFFFLGTIRYKLLIVLSIVLIGISVMVIYSTAVSAIPMARLLTTGGEQDRTTMYRMGLYNQAWRMFSDSPLVGTGHGHFPKHTSKYFDGRPPRDIPLRVHSVYFQLLAENGVFALVLYLWILALCIMPLLAMIFRMRAVQDRNVVVILLGLVLAMAFYATNTNLLEDSFAWLSFGLAQIARKTLDIERRQSDPLGLLTSDVNI